jgi:NAD(P)-dependent dehydrogenase (short-subunit alcohol dehydrogenase family)
MGLLYLARRIAPDMAASGEGAIIVTGDTSAQRGKANFAGFAPSKAAQHILAEATARETFSPVLCRAGRISFWTPWVLPAGRGGPAFLKMTRL